MISENKSAIVTGASGQLGSSICKKLLEHKYYVIGTDKVKPSVKIPGVDYYLYDTTDLASKESFYKSIAKKYENLDLLINNNGVAVFTDFMDRTEEEFDYVMNTNLKSVFFDIKLFVKQFDLSALKEAKIINISSIFGSVSPDYRNYTDLARNSSEVYGASKAGLLQMTKYFAVHLASRNISVNAISPGGIYNEENPQGEDFVRNYSYRTPMGRMAKVDEVSDSVLMFANNNSTYITGQNIIVDGGLTSW